MLRGLEYLVEMQGQLNCRSHQALGALQFVEFTKGGVVNVTALQPNEGLTRAKAVHSHHVVLPLYDMWMPSQWYAAVKFNESYCFPLTGAHQLAPLG